MTLANSPEGSNYVDIAAADIPGSAGLETPAVLQVTFAATPNRLSLRVGRRTRGTVTNLKSVYTPGDTLTFASVGVTDSVQWTESTNVADKTGRFELFAWIKDHAGVAGRFAVRAEREIAGVIQRGETTKPRISRLAGSAVTATTISTRATIPHPVVTGTSSGVQAATVATSVSVATPTVDSLPYPRPDTIATSVSIPTPRVGLGPVPPTIQTSISFGVPTHEVVYQLVPLGAFSIPEGTSSWIWRIVAWRTTGTDAVEVAQLIVVPMDESYVAVEWTAASNVSGSSVRTFTIDSIAGEAYWGSYGNEQTGGTITLRGSLNLTAGVRTRLVVQAAADTAWPAQTYPSILVAPFAPTSPVAVHVRPQYRGIR